MEQAVQRAKRIAVLVLGLGVAACSTPSERYGLAPPEKSGAYPNINLDPTVKSSQPVLTPQQRDAEEAELQRQAGKRPKTQSPAAN